MDLPVSPLTIGGTQGDQTPNLRASPHCLNLVVWIYLCMLLQINIQVDCNMPLPFTAPFVLLFVYLLSWSNCGFCILNFSKEKSYTQICIPVDFENNSGYYYRGQFSATPQQVTSEEALWYALTLIGAAKYEQKMQYLPSFWAVCSVCIISPPGLDPKPIENGRSLFSRLIGLGSQFVYQKEYFACS